MLHGGGSGSSGPGGEDSVDVTARPVKTFRHSARHGIAGHRENRNCSCCLRCELGHANMPHDDHIGIEAHEFGGDLRNALEFSLGGTSFRDKVATFDIAALP